MGFSEMRPLDWSNAEVEKAREVEMGMSNVDRIFIETSDMKNDLESYVYDMRDKVSLSSGLGSYASPSEKSTFSSALEKAEDWLYGDGYNSTKSAYAEKLTELRKMGDPLETRLYEAENRPSALNTLKGSIESYNNWLNSTATTDEQFSHLTEEELKKCHDACDAAAAWMYEMMDKQGSLASHEDPIVKVSDIRGKGKELTDTVNPIMRKPKPKPKPEEKKEDEKGENAAAADKKEGEGDNKPVPMETDEAAAGAASAEGKDGAPMETD